MIDIAQQQDVSADAVESHPSLVDAPSAPAYPDTMHVVPDPAEDPLAASGSRILPTYGMEELIEVQQQSGAVPPKQGNSSTTVQPGKSLERLSLGDRDSLLHLRSCAEHRIILNVGGKYFHTSVPSLCRIPGNLLSKLVHKDSPYYRAMKSKSSFFIDRDYKHFDVILNFLRSGGHIPPQMLPRDLRQLNELRAEAHFYQLQSLVKMIDLRLLHLCDLAGYM